jgi:hypothetical protein
MSRRALRTQDEEAASATRERSLAKTADYIPSDVLATYLAMWGLISPNSTTAKLVVFCCAAALAIVLPLLNWAVSQRLSSAGRRPALSKQLWVIAMGLVAFTAYAMTMPNSIFAEWFDAAPMTGGLAAIVLAVLLPPLAEFLDISPGPLQPKRRRRTSSRPGSPQPAG